MPQNKKFVFTEKQKKVFALVALGLTLAFCGLVGWFIGKPMLDFVSEPEKFRLWVDSHGILGRLAFVGMVYFQVVIALVPGEPLEIGGGYGFGAIEGTLLCLIGIMLGSWTVFFLVRRFGIKFVEIFFPREKISSLKILKSSKKRNALIFAVFFLPGTPKDLLTYFVGLTDIPFKHFLLLSSIARLPSVITSTLGGSALGIEDYTQAIIVFTVTLLLSGTGLIIYKKLLSKKREKQNEKPD